tara:strand:- start:332 stop:1843 length:1512 start_codon:yes stop_codon:yes gene_type:complete
MNINKQKNLSKLAIKNIFYNTSSNFIAKFSGFILSILLARILLPELFGVYTLVLSIVILAFSLSDLGITETSIKYISEAFGKNQKTKAFLYFSYFFKITLFLVLVITVFLLLFSQTIADHLFKKPEIFYPLLFAMIFTAINSILGIFRGLFYAMNDLKQIPLIYIILYSSKIILSLIVLMIFSGIAAISAVFIAFSISSLLTLTFMIILIKRKNFKFFVKKKLKFDNKNILNYLGYMTMANISILIFGSVDVLMLGRFVESAYIGYYQVAFGLIASLTAIISFSFVLLPIFVQVHSERLKKGFLKVLRYLSIISIPAIIGLLFISQDVISLIYGLEYSQAAIVLNVLAPLLFIRPIMDLYSSLFKAKNKIKFIAITLIAALILNIVLNYILITNLLEFGQKFAILGVAFATTISRIFYLLIIIVKTKSQFKINLPKILIIKPLVATIIMAIVLFIYNSYIDINILTGILEILTGIFVYFTTMFLIKGINKEDLDLVKSFLRSK